MQAELSDSASHPPAATGAGDAFLLAIVQIRSPANITLLTRPIQVCPELALSASPQAVAGAVDGLDSRRAPLSNSPGRSLPLRASGAEAGLGHYMGNSWAMPNRQALFERNGGQWWVGSLARRARHRLTFEEPRQMRRTGTG
jgi:hypothetical protein